jgi:hypothetical protein
MLKADPQDAGTIYNLHKEAKDKVTNLSRQGIKSLTQTYTGNTSLVAILIATITFTKKLMWLAYVATTTAFATGLYKVLAPRLLWLAIAVCVLTGSLPIFTKLLGEWPIWKLRFRLGRKFQSDLLNMV